MAQIISSYNVAHQLQNYVCEALSASEWLQQLSVNFFPENAKDIDYQIKNALAKQGLACVVMTPSLEYQGHDGTDIAWDAKDLTLQIAEYTPINRASNKLSVVTGLDLAVFAQNYLGGPQCAEEFGRFCPKAVTQSEEGGLLITKATFDTTVLGQIDGPYAWDGHHVITAPWALLSDLLELSTYAHSLPSVDTGPLQDQITTVSVDLSGLSTFISQVSGDYLPKVGGQIYNPETPGSSLNLMPGLIQLQQNGAVNSAVLNGTSLRVGGLTTSYVQLVPATSLTWRTTASTPDIMAANFKFIGSQNRTSSLADFLDAKFDVAAAQQLSAGLSNYLQLSGGTLAQNGDVHSAELTPSKIAMKSSEAAVQAEISYNNIGVADAQSGMEFSNQRFLTWTNADISPSALLSAFQFVTFDGLSTLADLVGSGGDMSNYYTKAEIDGMIGDIEELLETT